MVTFEVGTDVLSKLLTHVVNVTAQHLPPRLTILKVTNQVSLIV